MEVAEMVANPAQGPKYEVDIEGKFYPWDASTIRVPQLRILGNIPADQQMMVVDLQTNAERTLAEDEVIELKPGHGFAKKVKYQRGRA
jgi:hypothetical protein